MILSGENVNTVERHLLGVSIEVKLLSGRNSLQTELKARYGLTSVFIKTFKDINRYLILKNMKSKSSNGNASNGKNKVSRTG